MLPLKLKFVLVAGLFLVTAGCADVPGKTQVGQAAVPQLDAKREPANCLKETGTRLRPQEGKCLPYPGRVYTRDDINRTGTTSLGEALNRLGPL